MPRRRAHDGGGRQYIVKQDPCAEWLAFGIFSIVVFAVCVNNVCALHHVLTIVVLRVY